VKVKVSVKFKLSLRFVTEHPVMKAYWGMEVYLHALLTLANILNKQLHTADKGWSSGLGMGEELTAHRKISTCYQMLHSALEMARCFQHGNDPSGFIKGGELLDWLSDC